MVLDQTHKEKALQFLNSKWGHRACVMCATTKWTLGPIVTITNLQTNGDYNEVNPFLSVFCDNCGNTLFVDTAIAGILP